MAGNAAINHLTAADIRRMATRQFGVLSRCTTVGRRHRGGSVSRASAVRRCVGVVLQRVTSGAKGGEENTAAASAATVQQAGIALGAATVGLVANASGLDNGLDPGSVLRASLWVPIDRGASPRRERPESVRVSDAGPARAMAP
jgi:hypothetical protein